MGAASWAGDRVSWGQGASRVVQAPGEDVLGVLIEPSEFQTVSGDRITAVVAPVGDPGVADIVFAFDVDDCPYTVWIRAADTDAAIEYARSY